MTIRSVAELITAMKRTRRPMIYACGENPSDEYYYIDAPNGIINIPWWIGVSAIVDGVVVQEYLPVNSVFSDWRITIQSYRLKEWA